MSSNIRIEKVCQFCGRLFIAKTCTTRFCSHTCSQRNYKSRKRERHIEKITAAITETSVKEPTLHKEYMSCEQVADLMGISRTTVYRYCVTGKMNCIKMNRKIFIRKRDIELLFDEHPPYAVTPVECKPITEFYTLKEITDKYQVCESTVYNTVNAKRIPKVLFKGKTIYSKKHIDKQFSLKTPDAAINDWYSVEEIREKYGMSLSAVYSFNSENAIPRKKEKGLTYYSAQHVDALLQQRQPDPAIKEWYSMDDIVKLYKLEPGYISNLIYKNPIPKIRRGNKGYYSKEHFDTLMREKFPAPEYYTTEEAAAKFGVAKDVLYEYVKRHKIPTIKVGRCIHISKSHLDKLFENLKIR